MNTKKVKINIEDTEETEIEEAKEATYTVPLVPVEAQCCDSTVL
jgi:hypothetical protein